MTCMHLRHFWQGTVITAVCLSVCLFVFSLAVNSIVLVGVFFTKSEEQVDCGSEKSWLNFGSDPVRNTFRIFCLFVAPIFTGRVGTGGNAIASVCPSDRPSVSTLNFEPIDL